MKTQIDDLLAAWEGSDGLIYKLFSVLRKTLDEDSDEADAHYLCGLDSGNVRRFEMTLDTAYDRLRSDQRAAVGELLEDSAVPAKAREILAEYAPVGA